VSCGEGESFYRLRQQSVRRLLAVIGAHYRIKCLALRVICPRFLTQFDRSTMKNILLLGLALLIASHVFAQKNQKSAVYASENGAIKGYDPVAYFTDNQPVKGSPDIAFTWNGAVWHFANTAHRDSFALAPERWAPQYGGWCAYGWAQGYPAKIEPEAWSIVGGKLYLNYNLGIRKDWDKKQAEYIRKADENYQKAQKKQ
jgi:hypothetical protein